MNENLKNEEEIRKIRDEIESKKIAMSERSKEIIRAKKAYLERLAPNNKEDAKLLELLNTDPLKYFEDQIKRYEDLVKKYPGSSDNWEKALEEDKKVLGEMKEEKEEEAKESKEVIDLSDPATIEKLSKMSKEEIPFSLFEDVESCKSVLKKNENDDIVTFIIENNFKKPIVAWNFDPPMTSNEFNSLKEKNRNKGERLKIVFSEKVNHETIEKTKENESSVTEGEFDSIKDMPEEEVENKVVEISGGNPEKAKLLGLRYAEYQETKKHAVIVPEEQIVEEQIKKILQSWPGITNNELYSIKTIASLESFLHETLEEYVDGLKKMEWYKEEDREKAKENIAEWEKLLGSKMKVDTKEEEKHVETERKEEIDTKNNVKSPITEKEEEEIENLRKEIEADEEEIRRLREMIEQLPDEYEVLEIKERIADMLSSFNIRLKALEVKGLKDNIYVSAQTEEHGVQIDITLGNEEDSIGVKEYSVHAGFFVKGIAKKKVEEHIGEVSNKLKEYLEKESGKKVERIWIEDGKLNVTYINNNSGALRWR